LKSLPVDAYEWDHNQPFGYYTDGKEWYLISLGPDCRYNINFRRDFDRQAAKEGRIPFPSSLIFDPTNGTSSAGDIVIPGGGGLRALKWLP